MEKISQPESPRRARRRERLIELVQEAGGPAQMQRWVGTPKSHISALTAGTRGLGDELAAKLEEAYNKPPGWFDMTAADGNASSPLPLPPKVRPISVVGLEAGLMPAQIWTGGDLPTGATGESAEVATADPYAFLVRVVDASMIPRYNPGEFALVEPNTEPELEDDVYLRLVTGETMIKRLLARRDGFKFGSYNDPQVLHFGYEAITWIYYIAHPVPKQRVKAAGS